MSDSKTDQQQSAEKAPDVQQVQPIRVRIIPADTTLQQKTGVGGIDGALVRRAEKAMSDTAQQHDFEHIATTYLTKMGHAILDAKENRNLDPAEVIEDIRDAIMGIKEHAAFYNYELLGNLASIILNFLEQLKDIDADALEIMVANHKTLRIIISKQMRGTGGSYGRKLEEEVHDVCIRYMKRREV